MRNSGAYLNPDGTRDEKSVSKPQAVRRHAQLQTVTEDGEQYIMVQGFKTASGKETCATLLKLSPVYAQNFTLSFKTASGKETCATLAAIFLANVDLPDAEFQNRKR